MIVITPKEVQGSGHCFVCQNGIDRQTQTMVLDTLFDIELPGHYLDGRKYICQSCVQDLVRACGLLQATEVKDLQGQLAVFKVGYKDLLDSFRGLTAELGDKLTNLPIVPSVSYTDPNQLVIATEELEASKPKRGRPAKESTF